MHRHELALLLELMHQPTAPFRERHVVDFATAFLRDRDVPFFLDPLGNVVVGCESPRAYARLVDAPSKEPLRLFVAHMDHPGFHGMNWVARDRLRVRWHGGAPVRALAGARVWLADADGRRYQGSMRRVRFSRNRRTIETAEIHVGEPIAPPRPAARELYGGFRFRAPVWRSGQKLYTQAADDLVGVFAVLMTACDAQRRRRGESSTFLGLLTRAEEVGFIGAIGHFRLGWLHDARRKVICVSLETSRTLPNAVIGGGPIVRLGDRRTVFDASALDVLTQVARRQLPRQHQRRIMDGGACEATAATIYGVSAIGISVPLGNYHNQGFEGGADSRGRYGPAPEFVHVGDVDGLLGLCRGLLRRGLPWRSPWQSDRKATDRLFRQYRSLL